MAGNGDISGMDNSGIFKASHIDVVYPGRDGRVPLKAVNDVSFTLRPGETLGVVGESGSGKTTLARSVVRLQSIAAGSMIFEGRDISELSGRGLLEFREKVQMVFQDVSGALNPRYKVRRVLGEVLKFHGLISSYQEGESEIISLLDRVGLSSDSADCYPHEMSGGQRQRVGIARALAVRPRIIVADEPVSALDVSVQAQILALMRELQQELGISYLFIAHDLAVVKQVCDRVMVMHEGRVVEEGVAVDLLDSPGDDYTRSLLAAVPDIERGLERGRLSGRAELFSSGGGRDV